MKTTLLAGVHFALLLAAVLLLALGGNGGGALTLLVLSMAALHFARPANRPGHPRRFLTTNLPLIALGIVTGQALLFGLYWMTGHAEPDRMMRWLWPDTALVAVAGVMSIAFRTRGGE
jgi:hypothetical protein